MPTPGRDPEAETLDAGRRMSRRRLLRRATIAALVLVAAWYACSLAVGFGLSRRLVGPEIEGTPATGEIPCETLRLAAGDGAPVGAWILAPEASGASIVMLHGWRGSRSTVVRRGLALAQAGHCVLAPTLRAHGDATGSRYDFGAIAWRDVAVCVDELERRRPGRPIVVVGFSYGAAVAVEAAVREGARIDALVLDSMFADLRTAACNRCALFLPPLLEELAAAGLDAAAPIVFPEYGSVDPADTCARLDPAIPVLLVRGALDDRITTAECERVAAALDGRAESASFPSATHDRCFESGPQRWIATVSAFAQRAIPGR